MRILIITPSNIGDVVLTTPVITALLEHFKRPEISLVTSPRCRELFEKDPAIKDIYVFVKKAKTGQKLQLIRQLREQKFDLVVDFKHSLLPLMLYTKKRTSFFKRSPLELRHMRDRHLWRLKAALKNLPNKEYPPRIHIDSQAQESAQALLRKNAHFIAIAPGARSHTKRWSKERYLKLIKMIYDGFKMQVVLVGDKEDARISTDILKQANISVIDLCGKTGLRELAAVLKQGRLLISNDSAPMHIAWAVGTPVIGLFGPTDPEKYRPLGPKDIAISKRLDCSPCEKALCEIDNKHKCLTEISANEVFNAVKKILTQ